MATSTQRIFKATGLTLNGAAIDGISALSLTAAHRAVVVSTPDGAEGAQDVDRARMGMGINVVSDDVTSGLYDALAAAPGDTTWYSELAGTDGGAGNTRKHEILSASGQVVLDSWAAAFPQEADATMTVGGRIRHGGTATKIEDILKITDGQAAQAATYPVRLRLPRTAVFTPAGGAAIEIDNLVSVNVQMGATMIEDGGDGDVGMVDVDRIQWGPLAVSVVSRGASIKAAAAFTKLDNMVGDVRGVLTFQAVKAGSAGGVAPTLWAVTIRNLLWHDIAPNHGQEYSEWSLAGSCGWYDFPNTAQLDLTNAGTGLVQMAAV